MQTGLLKKVRRLAEAEELPEPTIGPGAPEDTPSAVDDSVENEIRSATHAILGHALGTSVYDSGYASELADMVEALAKHLDVPPTEVVRVMKGTVEKWRYASRLTLSDGTRVNFMLRIEVQ